MIEKKDILKLYNFCNKKNITLVVDESFSDFSDYEEWQSLLDAEIIKEYPELIIVKSISKSYGVPDLRL